MAKRLAALILLIVGATSCDGGPPPDRPAPSESATEAPHAGDYSKAEYEVDVTRGLLVPMRDGVHLCVDIYTPQGAGAHPAILTHTPYDNNGQRETAIWFARRGYVVVAADARGRYDSGGEWDPFGALHRVDGYDLVEWVAAQPWCTGKVGMIGGSYLGWTQWWAASMAPPHLAAIAPKVSPPDPFENLPYQHGVLLGGWMLDWAAGPPAAPPRSPTPATTTGGLCIARTRPIRPTSRSTSPAECGRPRGSRRGTARTGRPTPTGMRSGTRARSRTPGSPSPRCRSPDGSTETTRVLR